MRRISSQVRRRAAMDLEGIEECGELEERELGLENRVKRYKRIVEEVEVGLEIPTNGMVRGHSSTGKDCAGEVFGAMESICPKTGVGTGDRHKRSDIYESTHDERGDELMVVKGAGEISPVHSPKGKTHELSVAVSTVVNGTEVIDVDAITEFDLPVEQTSDSEDVVFVHEWKDMCTNDKDPMLKALSEDEKKMCRAGRVKEVVGRDFIDVQEASLRKVLTNRWFQCTVLEGFGIRVMQRSRERGLNHFVLPVGFETLLRTKKTKTGKGVIQSHYFYDKAQRYFRKYGIVMSDFDAVFLPVILGKTRTSGKGNHWILLILELSTKTMIHYNPITSYASPKTLQIINDLKHWLYDEVSSVKSEEFANEHFQLSCWKDVYDPSYPKQRDSDSCGLYVLCVMEMLTRGRLWSGRKGVECKMTFSEDHIAILRCRVALCLKNGFKNEK